MIKFRAWDKKTKTMYEVKSIVFTLQSMLCVNKKAVYPERTLYLDDDDTILMQYTGLKDKNGVEIFEGDVVKLQYTIASDFELFEVHQFRGGMWRIDNRRRGSELWLRNEDCEVIGNIYEHPHLLEEAK